MKATLLQQAADVIIHIGDAGMDETTMAIIKELAPKLKKKPAPPSDDEKAAFDDFRVLYRKSGTVLGLEVEMKLFIKHPDWREVLPTLKDNFLRQQAERQAMADNGKHVPDWPHLSTYINQRRWEMVYYQINRTSIYQTDSRPPSYLEWLKKFAGKYSTYSDVCDRAFTAQECQDWIDCAGIFTGLDRTYSEAGRKELLLQIHSDYFGSSTFKLKYPSLAAYFTGVKKQNQ